MMSFCLWDFPGGVQSSVISVIKTAQRIQQVWPGNANFLCVWFWPVLQYIACVFSQNYQKFELPNFPVFKQGPQMGFCKNGAEILAH